MQHDYLGNTLEITDLGTAAALIVGGFKLIGLESAGGRRFFFVFQNEKGISDAVASFWAGRFSVDAFSYFSAIKSLKTRIYNTES